MIPGKQWQLDYQKELDRAIQARANGNEGMARVCARRAGSIVIGEYLHRRNFSDLTNSIYDRLAIFTKLPDVEENCKQISRHLLIKVNHSHDLPIPADLIKDVILLKEILLKDHEL